MTFPMMCKIFGHDFPAPSVPFLGKIGQPVRQTHCRRCGKIMQFIGG